MEIYQEQTVAKAHLLPEYYRAVSDKISISHQLAAPFTIIILVERWPTIASIRCVVAPPASSMVLLRSFALTVVHS
jgi:hypothetical protein